MDDLTFGVLFKAQALGDYDAIREAGRHSIRIHLGAEPVKNLQTIVDGFENF